MKFWSVRNNKTGLFWPNIKEKQYTFHGKNTVPGQPVDTANKKHRPYTHVNCGVKLGGEEMPAIFMTEHEARTKLTSWLRGICRKNEDIGIPWNSGFFSSPQDVQIGRWIKMPDRKPEDMEIVLLEIKIS